MTAEPLKRAIRAVEAALTPRRSAVRFDARTLRFVRSHWWHDAYQESFDQEILPYLSPIRSDHVSTICDVGAATGLFAVAAAVRYASARVHAFEPSLRQRIMLRRNVRMNSVAHRVQLNPVGLWKASGQLAFRTHGALSSLHLVSELPPDLEFGETVPVTTLDEWSRRTAVARIDLIKMDIEGAEIEALEGGIEILERDRPELLIQAYHLRDGNRTFERCAAFLRARGYAIEESGTGTGLLHAVHS